MSRKISNGGVIGQRNLPNAGAAPGIWDIEDAYFASRDANWPRWPQDVGVPLKNGLRVWLEADFGVYADAGLNTVQSAVNGDVNAWFNRGDLGAIVRDGGAAWKLEQVNGKPVINMNSTSASQLMPARVKSHNYLFVKAYLSTNSISNFFMPHDSASGFILPTQVPRLAAQSGSTFQFPVSNSANASNTLTAADASWGEAGRVDFAYASNAAPGGVLQYPNAVGYYQAPGSPVVTAFTTPNLPAGVDYTQTLRVLGGRNSSGFTTAGGKIQALLWYSLDEPMTTAEINAVAAYLIGKYGTS